MFSSVTEGVRRIRRICQTTTDTHPMLSHQADDLRLPEGVRPITHRHCDPG